MCLDGILELGHLLPSWNVKLLVPRKEILTPTVQLYKCLVVVNGDGIPMKGNCTIT